MQELRYGLVLAGGGGKGAYQIGVLKALTYLGFTPEQFTAMAGSSVGALNLALYLHNDLALAEQVWLSITPDQILTVDPELLLAKVAQTLVLAPALKRKVSRWLAVLAAQGVFSRSGIRQLIDEHLTFEQIQQARSKAFVACTRIPVLRAEYFLLNECSTQQITAILLASSALPVIYKPVKVGKHYYIDGGVLDNVPILPVYQMGCNMIFVVHLTRNNPINPADYPNARILEIVPQNPLGSLFDGTLDFSPDGARQRMELGFKDGMKIIKQVLAFAQVQSRSLIQMQRWGGLHDAAPN